MSCTCNEFSLCDEHYNEYLAKYNELIKECIIESLKRACEVRNLHADEKISAIEASSCETAIRHEGTMQLLKVIQYAEKQGCSAHEIREAVLGRLGELKEFDALSREITE